MSVSVEHAKNNQAWFVAGLSEVSYDNCRESGELFSQQAFVDIGKDAGNNTQTVLTVCAADGADVPRDFSYSYQKQITGVYDISLVPPPQAFSDSTLRVLFNITQSNTIIKRLSENETPIGHCDNGVAVADQDSYIIENLPVDSSETITLCIFDGQQVDIQTFIYSRVQEPLIEPEKGEITVHFYQRDWQVANLHYRTDGAWTAVPGVAMGAEGDGWWGLTVPATVLEFTFNNGQDWVNLGSTDGNYPGSTPENFKVSHREVWVKDHVLYTRHPQTDKPAGELTVLSLNLHTYQENKQPDDTPETRIANHQKDFETIGQVIQNLDADIVCLQEVAQVEGQIDTNMAHKINERLNSAYYVYTDWSHYGFNNDFGGWQGWQEGVAILSKTAFDVTESRYVSVTSSKNSFESRNIARVETTIPTVGRLSVFSVHTGFIQSAT